MKKFSRDAKIFMAIQTLFVLSTSLSATFVNVYMWHLTSDLRYIGMYNIVVFSFVPLAFVLSGVIARRKGINTCSRLGVLGYIVFYLVILIMKDGVKDYLLILGAFYGLGMGFYYFGNNTLVYHYTESENRSHFLGLSGAMGSVMGTIAPIVSGWIIVSNTSLRGYYLLFFASLLLFVVSIVLSYFLNQEKVMGKYQLKSILFNREDRSWNKLLMSNYISGFRDGALAYIVNILIFLVLKNELNMGKFTTVISVLGIASTYITGRLYKKKHQNTMLAAGAILSFAGTVILVVWTNFWGIVINGVLTSVFACFWGIPYSIMNYEIAGKRASKHNNMGDYMIAKEVPLALGRISGIVLYIVISGLLMDESAIKLILPLLSSMIIVNFVYLKVRA